jgi:hypothetical protein
MTRFYVSAHLAMLDPAMPVEGFTAVIGRLNDALHGPFPARAFGTSRDFVIGAEINAGNEEGARDLWFRFIDRALGDAGIAASSRYATRLIFERIERS